MLIDRPEFNGPKVSIGSMFLVFENYKQSRTRCRELKQAIVDLTMNLYKYNFSGQFLKAINLQNLSPMGIGGGISACMSSIVPVASTAFVGLPLIVGVLGSRYLIATAAKNSVELTGLKENLMAIDSVVKWIDENFFFVSENISLAMESEHLRLSDKTFLNDIEILLDALHQKLVA